MAMRRGGASTAATRARADELAMDQVAGKRGPGAVAPGAGAGGGEKYVPPWRRGGRSDSGPAPQASCPLEGEGAHSSETSCELGNSSLDCTNMERNGLQEHDVPGRPLGISKRKLLVLDLNGLLVDIVYVNKHSHNALWADGYVREKAVFKRPYCDGFLKFCAWHFEIGIWSSRIRENVDIVLDIVMRGLEPKPCLLFRWDRSKCTRIPGRTAPENKNKPLMLKELRKLWDKEESPDLPWEKGDYSASNTLLVDDSRYKAQNNPAYTAIFPPSYSYLSQDDNSLGPNGDLCVYLQKLATADDVQRFVRDNPFG